MDITSRSVIVITGSSSGVGKAMALELAKSQPILVLAARRTSALEELAEECRSLGATAHVVTADIRNIADVIQLVQAAARHTGSIDVWINNAGVLAAGALEDVPPAINEEVIRTNLLGYIHGAQQVLPYFKEQGYGILINNISVGGWLPTPFATAYSASKYGLRGFSEALKGELSRYPAIHVVDLYPSFLDTPGLQHAGNYTGRVLKPAPPVVHPNSVARAVVQVIRRPVSRKTVGIPSAMLRLSYALLPRLTRNVAASVIRTYLKNAVSIAHTPGNIIAPVAYGTSVDGGWSTAPSKKIFPFAVMAAFVTAAAIVHKYKSQG